MSYGRVERHISRLLDSTPRVRKLAKAGYQRLNYLLHGWRRTASTVHPLVSIERVPVSAAADSVERREMPETFFGYFDISPWSRNGRFYLLHVWDRKRPGTVDVCIHDRHTAGLTVIGSSSAWNFQQGSMAQWLPGQDMDTVVFNDVVDRHLVCRIMTMDGQERQLPWPVQALHPGGQAAISINYRRLARIRPEYGYAPEVENFASDQALEEDGIWGVDLRSGTARLVVSLRELSEIDARPDMRDADHKVNHVVYSPSGDRVVFMHRWFGRQGKFSRLYCARSDGTELRLLLDHRVVSHYAWQDDRTLLVWARTPADGDCYYLVDVEDGEYRVFGRGVLDPLGDGHPSFSPDREWVVTDTYPDRARMRHLLLFQMSTQRLVEVGAFFAPWRYDGPVRCDLHPRWSPDGQAISIDSAHEGVRSTYVIDVSRLRTS